MDAIHWQEGLITDASFVFEQGSDEVWISRSKEGSEVDPDDSSPSSSYSSLSLRLPSPALQTLPQSSPLFAHLERVTCLGDPGSNEPENTYLAGRRFRWRRLRNFLFTSRKQKSPEILTENREEILKKWASCSGVGIASAGMKLLFVATRVGNSRRRKGSWLISWSKSSTLFSFLFFSFGTFVECTLFLWICLLTQCKCNGSSSLRDVLQRDTVELQKYLFFLRTKTVHYIGYNIDADISTWPWFWENKRAWSTRQLPSQQTCFSTVTYGDSIVA